MRSPDLKIIATGIANTASVVAAFDRQGVQSSLTVDPDAVRHASYVVLPGVGAFSPAMQRLHTSGVEDALRERIAADKPTLAICLGLQLLGASSEESPGVSGIGIHSATATEFPTSVRRPKLGWNRVLADPECSYLKSGYAYFAHTYRLTETPTGFRSATADYGLRYVAAMERGALLACQFHPELSGSFGADLIQRWLSGGSSSC